MDSMPSGEVETLKKFRHQTSFTFMNFMKTNILLKIGVIKLVDFSFAKEALISDSNKCGD